MFIILQESRNATFYLLNKVNNEPLVDDVTFIYFSSLFEDKPQGRESFSPCSPPPPAQPE